MKVKRAVSGGGPVRTSGPGCGWKGPTLTLADESRGAQRAFHPSETLVQNDTAGDKWHRWRTINQRVLGLGLAFRPVTQCTPHPSFKTIVLQRELARDLHTHSPASVMCVGSLTIPRAILNGYKYGNYVHTL